jgi:hypothetical protein
VKIFVLQGTPVAVSQIIDDEEGEEIADAPPSTGPYITY